MIKLVQGFDICSPLPIDGRILLSKSEMYNIDDNILPERYFAFCKDDGRLYLYYKSNVPNSETGKFILADTTIDTRIDHEVEVLNDRVDNEVETLNTRVDNEVQTLNTRVDTEVSTLNTRIDGEVETLNTKIDNYKVEADEKFIDGDELTTALLPYSLIDATGNKVRINFDEHDFKLSVTLLDANDNELSTTEEIDIPLESVVIDGRYDAETKELILTLVNGNEIKFSIADLIDGLVNETDFQNHVNNNDRHINAGEREMWNLAETALQPEVLNDYYTKEEIDTKVVAGDNVNVELNSEGNIIVSAVDTTYSAGPGVTINEDNQISTNSAAPEWSAIEGEDPLENVALDSIITPMKNEVEALNNEVYGTDSEGSNGLIYRVNDLDERTLAHITNNDIHVTAAQKEAWTAKYDKPAGGIPNADLSTYVRNRVAKVDKNSTAIEGINTEIENIKQQMADESKLEEEIARATAAEAALGDRITAEETARNSAISTLQSSLNTEAQTRESADNRIDGKITNIEAELQVINSKIPNAATSENQLADKAFVNSSIATSTADFKGTKETKAEIRALTGNINDYAYLKVMDPVTGLVKQYDRYKYSEIVDPETGNWEFEYTLNNSSFTAEQWAAINSNATAELIAKISTNENAISTLSSSKVNVETGKSLVSDIEITRLASMANNATSVTESQTNGNIRVTTRSNGTESTSEVNVYTLLPKFDETVVGSNNIKANIVQAPISSGSSDYGVGTTGQVLTSNGSRVYWGDSKNYVSGVGLTSEDSGNTTIFKQTYRSDITIQVADWTAVSDSRGKVQYYQATKTGLTGISIDSNPILDIFISPDSYAQKDAITEAWSNIFSATTGSESITFYATKAPTVAITVQAKGY